MTHHRQPTAQTLMKKAFGETQTLRAGCSKAEPKIFAPPQTPFPGARDGQSLISWRWSLPLPIQTHFGEDRLHAVSSYRGNRPTNKQTHPLTHTHTNPQTGPITIHCATASLARSVNRRALNIHSKKTRIFCDKQCN